MLKCLSNADAVFGADLKQLCTKEKQKVPNFVTKCIEEIERRGKRTFIHLVLVALFYHT